jgi:pimeloyl-ACP methyl ester carboxylesterase
VAADISAAPPDVAREALASSLAYAREVPNALRELGLPVVAINAMDEPTDIDTMRRNGVHVELMPGVGHFPMLERPQAFNTTLATIVAQFG